MYEIPDRHPVERPAATPYDRCGQNPDNPLPPAEPQAVDHGDQRHRHGEQPGGHQSHRRSVQLSTVATVRPDLRSPVDRLEGDPITQRLNGSLQRG